MLLFKRLLFFAILLANLWCVRPFEFEDAQEDGVEFVGESSGAYIVRAEENNISTRIKVVKITGGGTIAIETQTTNNQIFQPQVETRGSDTFITTNRVDYEALDSIKQLVLRVTDSDDGSTKQLAVQVINLDDENPIITTTSTCSMEENEKITLTNSNCSYTITDRDGFLDEMVFELTDHTDLFEFKYETPPGSTTFSATMKLVLKPDQTLDYETITLYTFYLKTTDSGGNPSIPPEVQIIVRVIDMPDEPPQWDSNFRSAMTIDEEQESSITVTAKDGDYGINNHISYSVEDESGYISIDANTGFITIQKIDRDQSGNEEITFAVIATEVEQPDSQISSNITLIVNDIDDNRPEITVTNADGTTAKEVVVEIDEGATEIDIDIEANDIDLGENAIYTAKLTSSNEEFLSAFTVIPSRGYEKTSLVLTISNPSKLDYEKESWRNIAMELVTAGTKNEEMTDKIPITITLKDLNDETPTFDKEEYTVSVREDVEMGTVLLSIQATDEDAEDIEKGITHQLLGTLANNILTIEELGGNITTKKDNAFDYEKQNEVVIQISATDNNDHTASAQLTITVIDVNDENPRLTVSSAIEVKENGNDGDELVSNIQATDDDTTANLIFSIDWDKSYATKNSQRLSIANFSEIHCVKIETVPGETNNQASAKLTLIETQPKNTPDFEVFDNLYLYVEVRDDNTEINSGTDAAFVVINVIDINDNEPVFNAGTETDFRQVTENSPSQTVISSVIATDRDVGTELEYSIESVNGSPDWVSIDPKSGRLYVDLADGEQLDCDNGPIYNLTYVVTASDGEYNTSSPITITLNDQNDNEPVMDEQTGSIPEDSQLDPSNTSDGVEVLTLAYKDGDRDEPYHTVECRFSTDVSSDVTRRFKIDNNKIVVDLSSGETLDAEDFRNFDFFLTCLDDPTRQGAISYTVTPRVYITLEDINDNYPTIRNKRIAGLSENSAGTVSQKLEGEDLDENDNGLINFIGITKIERFLNDNLEDGEIITENLFSIATDSDNKTGILRITSENLKDYYGYLVLTISLTDLGEKPLAQEVDVILEVQRYNFEEPIFKFPKDGMTYYLTPNQGANKQLQMYNLSPFRDIEVDDQQGLKYEFTFSVENNENNSDLFGVKSLQSNTGQLFMKTDDFEERDYTVTVRATIKADAVDNNEASYSKDCTFIFKFFDEENADPVFETNEGSVNFYENDTTANFPIPNATYPDIAPNITASLSIYYYLDDGNNDYRSKFQVDKDSGLLTLIEALDYETFTSYTLVIQSSKEEKVDPTASDQTKYTLTVNVRDVNDNPPLFDAESYTGVLNVAAGDANINILVVSATDVDTTSTELQFSISSVTGSNSGLETVAAGSPFDIERNTGNTATIKPRIAISNTLSGYFDITVKVEDEDKFYSEVEVIVYLVTSENIVAFSFGNTQTEVGDAKDIIKQILDEQFADKNYITTVDTVRIDQTDDETDRTIQNVYFVDSKTQAPVSATDIYKEVTNANVYRDLKKKFLDQGLDLLSFASETESSTDMETVLKAWLIGVSVVLGSLCMILLVAFILKTRALNQRINKLSNTKFGSQESGMNRIGITAPTTNKHAVEGSNPVYNNEVDTKDIDRRSVTSGGSELIGVEDDEKFSYSPGSIHSRDESVE